jgi:hypothetical protein
MGTGVKKNGTHIRGASEEATTMNRAIISSVFVLLGLSASAMGCSRAAAVCDLICTCEHCNDQHKIEACNQLEITQDYVNAYDCGDAWEKYMICFEERGTCDETESRFSVENEAGDSRCQNEADALNECISEASAHNGTGGPI